MLTFIATNNLFPSSNNPEAMYVFSYDVFIPAYSACGLNYAVKKKKQDTDLIISQGLECNVAKFKPKLSLAFRKNYKDIQVCG
jgi:hypothetical protein